MKMAVFWVVAPCSLVVLMMEARGTSETSVNFYQTTRRYNLEDSQLLCLTSYIKYTVYAIKVHNMQTISSIESNTQCSGICSHIQAYRGSNARRAYQQID
jgi:hypothetical protein